MGRLKGFIREIHRRLRAWPRMSKKTTLRNLAEAARNASPDVRARALLTLARRRYPSEASAEEVAEVRRTILEALDASDLEVKRAAAWALVRFGDPEAVEPLIRALTHQDRTVRMAATQALGRIAHPMAAGPLASILKSSDSVLRFDAKKALAAISGPQIIPHILPPVRRGRSVLE